MYNTLAETNRLDSIARCTTNIEDSIERDFTLADDTRKIEHKHAYLALIGHGMRYDAVEFKTALDRFNASGLAIQISNIENTNKLFSLAFANERRNQNA